jgi:mono/diheme cytochrome c family protein
MNTQSLKFAVIHAGLLAALASGCGGGSAGDTAGNSGAVGGDDEGDDTTPKKDGGKAPTTGSTPSTGATAKGDAGAATANGKTTGSKIPCDVQAILTKNCAMCHDATTAFGAPMSLAKLADFQAKATTGATMVEAVKTRINDTNPKTAMPPSSGTKLTSDQLATLNKWLAGGATGSSESCDATKPAATTTTDDTFGDDSKDLGDEGLDCYPLTGFGGSLTEKYPVGVAVDKYVNFTFKAPWTGTAYGVRFVPIIDNKKALHHFLLFQDSSMKAPGSAGSSGAHPDGQLVYGWAPGGNILDLRVATKDSVGFELASNVSYTVEMHYNSMDATAQDASGVKVCVAKAKPDNIAGISWLGYDQLLVPATEWTGECVPENTMPVRILGVQPHMHTAGTHMKTIIHRKGGGDEVLHDAPFDFNNQHHYLKNVTIMPGDSLTTSCTYDKPMAFGESTGEEMCYNFTFAYPKGALKDSGAWGGVAHGGSACLGQ